MLFVFQREKVQERGKDVCAAKDPFDRTLLHTHGTVTKQGFLPVPGRTLSEESCHALMGSFLCLGASCAVGAAAAVSVTIAEASGLVDHCRPERLCRLLLP